MSVFNTTTNYQKPSGEGYYGDFGGAYIPEMLYENVETLKVQYLQIMEEPAFKAEVAALLKDYVGRPTPLFLAERLSKEIGATIYLKREDLCHTGAHKINNTIGQIILAQRLGKTKIIAETGAGKSIKDSRKNCQVNVDLRYPEGWSYSIVSVDGVNGHQSRFGTVTRDGNGGVDVTLNNFSARRPNNGTGSDFVGH